MKPFKVTWSADVIVDLKRRLADAPVPTAPKDAGWTLGCDRDYLLTFRSYLLEEFDWMAGVTTLNRHPQFTADVDGMDIHFVHVPAETVDARPLLLTHGWPGSHLEFWGVIDALTHPSRHGGSQVQAFHVVIPSLPGYGFSDTPQAPMGPRRVAALWNRLMTSTLGYKRYWAQGGDWGGIVTSHLGVHHHESVAGIHLNFAALRSSKPPQDEAEARWAMSFENARAQLGAYAVLQRTRPMSLAYAATGNPLGQVAWILERFHDWADLSRGTLDEVFGRDFLATNIALYLMNDRFASSLWIYHGLGQEGAVALQDQWCAAPTAFAAFPGDGSLPAPPRSRLELSYNLVRYSQMPYGGHFGALEAPQAFVDDLRGWITALPRP